MVAYVLKQEHMTMSLPLASAVTVRESLPSVIPPVHHNIMRAVHLKSGTF